MHKCWREMPSKSTWRVLSARLSSDVKANFFIYKPTARTAMIISVRDMSDKERKAYGRK